MGKAIELITTQVTAPGAAFVPMPAVSGDSLTIRNSLVKAQLLHLWSHPQGSGILKITSPLLHDTTNGLSFHHGGTNESHISPGSFRQFLEPQDTLQVQWTGSAVAGDIEQAHLQIYYPDLPGVDGRFIAANEVVRRLITLFSLRLSLSPGTSGGYSGAEAINSDSDTFKANTDYAILGASMSISGTQAAIGVRSPDWGNLRVGIPIVGAASSAANYFMDLAEATGLPLVPVFNSSNRAQTLVDLACNENGTGVGLSLLLAELSKVK